MILTYSEFEVTFIEHLTYAKNLASTGPRGRKLRLQNGFAIPRSANALRGLAARRKEVSFMDKKIYCNNYFCGYWKNFRCILGEIELDNCGNCANCCLIDIDSSLLEKLRKRSLKAGAIIFYTKNRASQKRCPILKAGGATQI